MSLACALKGSMVGVHSKSCMPGSFLNRRCSLVLSALKPPMKAGSSAISSPGKKQRRTIPLGIYMMTNFLSGFSPAFGIAAMASGTECKKGSAIVAPPAFRNLRRLIVMMLSPRLKEYNARYSPLFARCILSPYLQYSLGNNVLYHLAVHIG